MIYLSRRLGATNLGFFWNKPNKSTTSLSSVLQAHVSPKYFLSPKAAVGILRRAEKRGRELPEPLRSALTLLASEDDNREVRQAMYPMPSPDLQATPDMIPTGRTS